VIYRQFICKDRPSWRSFWFDGLLSSILQHQIVESGHLRKITQVWGARKVNESPFALIVGNGGVYGISDSYIRMAPAIPDAGVVGRGRQSLPKPLNSEGFWRIIGEQ
jgi:hypothetical protein